LSVPAPPPRLAARRQTDRRPPRERARLWARLPPLGRRAHFRLAPQPAPPARPQRPPGRHPPMLPRARLLPYRLAPAGDLIGVERLAARFSAAKFAFSCVPSQNGFVPE